MKHKFFSRFQKPFLLMILIWFLVNILQSIFTELGNDEAYYWVYSQHLAWGYFDHPPMVALFIKIGTFFSKNELGVRLMTVLSQLVLLCSIWLLIDEKKPDTKKILSFFGIAASVVMFQAYGFITTPDAPLLVFTGLFLLAYKRFIDKDNLLNIFILSLFAAFLLYSKYQGGIVILLVVLSNLKLFKSYKIWLVGLLTAILFFPHIYWQISNDFPTFKFHLISRAQGFDIKYVLEYWANQMAVFNPFLLGLVIYILFKFRPKDAFERALYFIIFGFLGFFWLTSLRGHVEPHWTIAACVPMIILVYRRLQENANIQKYARRFLFPTIVLILFIRLVLIFDILPIKLEFHGQKKMAQSIEKIVGDKPVVFLDSYQKPSVYMFYTGKTAFTLNSISYRQCQYDLWPMEEQLHGKPAVLVTSSEDPLAKEYQINDNEKIWLHTTDSLMSVQKMQVIFSLPRRGLYLRQLMKLRVKIVNPYPYKVSFNSKEFPVSVSGVFVRNGIITFSKGILAPTASIQPKDTIETTVLFDVPKSLDEGYYSLGISLRAGVIGEGFNSKFIKIYVKEKKWKFPSLLNS